MSMTLVMTSMAKANDVYNSSADKNLNTRIIAVHVSGEKNLDKRA